MADISVTASSVVPGAGAALTSYTAGATITAGQPVYLDTSDRTVKLADADALATAAAIGISVHGASAGQPISVVGNHGARITFNAGFTKNVPVFVSTTAGGMCPIGDLASGDYVTLLGIPESTTSLIVGILASGVAI